MASRRRSGRGREDSVAGGLSWKMTASMPDTPSLWSGRGGRPSIAVHRGHPTCHRRSTLQEGRQYLHPEWKALLRRAQVRSDGGRFRRGQVLLQARGGNMRLGRAMLLRHLRLPRQGWHLLPVPRSHLQCRSAVLWWSRLYRRILRRLPRPCGFLHQLFPVLLQRLHERRLSVGERRAMCPRRRLPRLLLGPELHERLRQRRL